jgi:hypothetical protein
MDIPTYKIHHVLEAFARRLAQRESAPEKPGQDRSRNAPEGRQRELIDQVSERIIRQARELAEEKSDRVSEPAAPWGRSPAGSRPVFTYDEITPDGRRIPRTLTLDDTTFLSPEDENSEKTENEAPHEKDADEPPEGSE